MTKYWLGVGRAEKKYWVEVACAVTKYQVGVCWAVTKYRVGVGWAVIKYWVGIGWTRPGNNSSLSGNLRKSSNNFCEVGDAETTFLVMVLSYYLIWSH